MGQNFFINLPNTGGGDLLAAYLLVSGSDPQGNLTNFRTITAGPNTAILDNGPGQTLILSCSGINGTNGATGATGATGSTGPAGAQGAAGAFGGQIGQIGSGGGAVFAVTTQGILMMSTSVGTLSASLPTAQTGSIIFKDCQGSASINPFTVYPTGGAKIDAMSSSYTYYVNFGTMRLFSDGHDWFTW